jgi:NAD(P)-dependent dehydrogenase (short-subunit alcohol dehydrogenase family)
LIADHQPQKRVALVTGAARRIGRAIAERLAADGWQLALHASERSRAEAEALADAIRVAGGRADVFCADLADVAETGGLIARVGAACGPSTLLVNNASIFAPDSAATFDAAAFEAQMAVNLRAPLQLASDFARALPLDRAGSIVNILDQRVWRPTPQFFSYTLAKSALWTATRTMAQSFAPRIRVNGVGPGPTLPNPSDGEAGFLHEAATVPLGHAVDPAEIAAAVAFLAEARSVTGQMIAVDAGQHLAWRTPDIVGEI